MSNYKSIDRWQDLLTCLQQECKADPREKWMNKKKDRKGRPGQTRGKSENERN